MFLQLADRRKSLVVDGLDEDGVCVERVGRVCSKRPLSPVAHCLLQLRRVGFMQSLVADQIVKSFTVTFVFRHRLQNVAPRVITTNLIIKQFVLLQFVSKIHE